VTLFDFVVSNGLTARQADAVIEAFGSAEELSSREPLSEPDLARLLLLTEEAQRSDCTYRGRPSGD